MFSPKQMYTIVADIEAYPHFLQWCSQTRIIQSEGEGVIATVDIDFKGIKQSFTTKNVNIENSSIEMELYNDDSFEHLNGGWQFQPIEMEDKMACKVVFTLDFSMKNKIASTIFKTVFTQIINSQVDGFVKRAEDLYG